ncbi:MAG TPA: class IV adenylate cyclase [Candidatus Binatia bacterium]|nr:class IV adenylate cyclase [Candidatus Binatia bacterium]
MPSNVEIKAILRDRPRVEALAAKLADRGPQLIQQEDFFFPCADARLKLRVLGEGSGELIRYNRPDGSGMRTSQYLIARTPDPRTLLEILTKTLGLSGVVKKERTLYLIGQTRVHFDRVEGLGDFLELEVVMRVEQPEEDGRAVAESLIFTLGIQTNDLIGGAYVDLLAVKNPPTGTKVVIPT